MLTFAIGDIHGCADHLEAMLAKIDKFHQGREHRIITLGDYIDRGPDSKRVLDILMDRPDIIKLRGNHEEMLLSSLDGDLLTLRMFLGNGGYETLNSFSADAPEQVDPKYIRFLHEMRVSFETERHFYCHAGVKPGVPLSEQKEQDLLWIRDEFLRHKGPFEKYIVHGHTPDDRMRIGPYRTNVDSGCVFTGTLSCAVIEDGTDLPLDEITVSI